MLKSIKSIMIGLGKWTRAWDRVQSTRPKARKKSSRGKSSLSKKGLISDSGESAAVHHAQTSIPSLSDDAGKGDYDPVVVRTVENLSEVGSDIPASVQEKEARSSGGTPVQ